jgi:hypothetical protein
VTRRLNVAGIVDGLVGDGWKIRGFASSGSGIMKGCVTSAVSRYLETICARRYLLLSRPLSRLAAARRASLSHDGRGEA